MTELAPETISLLQFLLPGFVARWVFHGLTAFKRADSFERIVEALIFTALVQAIVVPVKDGLLAIGAFLESHSVNAPAWRSEYILAYSVFIALVVGVLAAGLANNDFIHRWLRNRHLWLVRHKDAEKWNWKDWRWTKRTSIPTQWYASFSKLTTWIVLHLSDGRRLYGWAWEWPDDPNEGHFSMCHAEWLVGEERQVVPSEVILISVAEVKMIEFVKSVASTETSSTTSWWSHFFTRESNGNRSTETATAGKQQAATATCSTDSTIAAVSTASPTRLNGQTKGKKKHGKRK